MKLKVRFDPETRFDQSIRRIAQGTVVVRRPGFVKRSRDRRTAKADQALIDLWIFLRDSSP